MHSWCQWVVFLLRGPPMVWGKAIGAFNCCFVTPWPAYFSLWVNICLNLWPSSVLILQATSETHFSITVFWQFKIMTLKLSSSSSWAFQTPFSPPFVGKSWKKEVLQVNSIQSLLIMQKGSIVMSVKMLYANSLARQMWKCFFNIDRMEFKYN